MFRKIVIFTFMTAVMAFGALEASAKGRSAGSSGKSYSSSRSHSYNRPFAKPRGTYNRPSMRQRNTYRRPQTVIQKNYYGGNRGYRGNGGGVMGGGMGGAPGLGTSLLGGAAGAVGGMMLYDALTESDSEKLLKQQQEQQKIDRAVQEQQDRDQMQRIEQKLDAEQKAPSDPYFQLNPNLLPGA